jgi:hypothetical protein
VLAQIVREAVERDLPPPSMARKQPRKKASRVRA